MLMLLELLQNGLVFGLAVEPEQEGNAKGRERHHSERQPVQHMWGELAVKVLHCYYAALSRLGGVSKLKFFAVLRASVSDLGACEVEPSVLDCPDDSGVGDIATWWKPVELELEKAADNLEVSLAEGVVHDLHVQGSASTDVVDVVVDDDVPPLNKIPVQDSLLHEQASFCDFFIGALHKAEAEAGEA
uniref:Putative signal sequence receptor beta n=1 Tax=Ixodes ricinus TaxID=34613 RepID=A0A6B0UZT4_IXORI